MSNKPRNCASVPTSSEFGCCRFRLPAAEITLFTALMPKS